MLHCFSEWIWYSDPVAETDRPSLGYIDGGKHRLMIDAGASKRHAEEFLALLAKRGVPTPDMVVVTHSHWDHSYGLCALHERGILSFSSAATRRDLERDLKLEWSAAHLERYLCDGTVPQFCVEHMRREYADPAEIAVALPQVTYEGQITIDLGECWAVLYQMKNPHMPDSTVIFIPQEKMVFFGDAVYEKLCGNEWIDQKDKVAALMRALTPLDFTRCHVAHGSPVQRSIMTREELFEWFEERSGAAKSCTS